MRTALRDLVVVLPGIMGSRLRRGEDLVWDPGLGMAKRLIGHKRWVASLVAGEERFGDTAPLDGVIAEGHVPSRTIIPGIKRIGGYSELHEVISNAFIVVEGDQHDPAATMRSIGRPANYFRFSYDWRRDNRNSALQLRSLINAALPALRTFSPDAKVVLIAHSMGGLVARWYLEGDDADGNPIEGWRDTRQLITFGTPYRGSVNALQFLVEGYRRAFVDLSEALGSFTSIYQLMPRYRTILDQREVTSHWRYPKDLVGVGGLDQARAVEAYEFFHRVIEDGVTRHRVDPDYDDRHVTPIVGYGHDTSNSVTLDMSALSPTDGLPPGVPHEWEGGDGTVPYVSAMPIDYSDPNWGRVAPVGFLNEKHGAMQTGRRALASEVVHRLRLSQVGADAVRNQLETSPHVPATPQIGLNLSDWITGDSVAGTVRTNLDCGDVEVSLRRVAEPGGREVEDKAVTVRVASDGRSAFAFDGVRPGDHEITAMSTKAVEGTGRLTAVDLLAVLEEQP